MRVAAARTVSMPSPTTSWGPAGHSFTAPTFPSDQRSILWCVAGQRDPVNSGRLIGDDVAHEREQAGMARSVEWAMRVESQHLVDVCRQGGEVDSAGLGEIAGRQRSGDWACSRPKSQRIVSIGIGFDLVLFDRCAVPILEIFNRVRAAHAFDRNQPIDLVAVRTAAEAVVMIGID